MQRSYFVQINPNVPGFSPVVCVEEKIDKENKTVTNPIEKTDYVDPYKQKAKVSLELALVTLLPKKNLIKSEVYKAKEKSLHDTRKAQRLDLN